MAAAAPARITPPLDDKKRTTLTLPGDLLAEAEEMASRKNTTVSAIVAQAMEAGLPILSRRDQAMRTYESMRAALGDLTEEERMLVDGIRLTEGLQE